MKLLPLFFIALAYNLAATTPLSPSEEKQAIIESFEKAIDNFDTHAVALLIAQAKEKGIKLPINRAFEQTLAAYGEQRYLRAFLVFLFAPGPIKFNGSFCSYLLLCTKLSSLLYAGYKINQQWKVNRLKKFLQNALF